MRRFCNRCTHNYVCSLHTLGWTVKSLTPTHKKNTSRATATSPPSVSAAVKSSFGGWTISKMDELGVSEDVYAEVKKLAGEGMDAEGIEEALLKGKLSQEDEAYDEIVAEIKKAVASQGKTGGRIGGAQDPNNIEIKKDAGPAGGSAKKKTPYIKRQDEEHICERCGFKEKEAGAGYRKPHPDEPPVEGAPVDVDKGSYGASEGQTSLNANVSPQVAQAKIEGEDEELEEKKGWEGPFKGKRGGSYMINPQGKKVYDSSKWHGGAKQRADKARTVSGFGGMPDLPTSATGAFRPRREDEEIKSKADYERAMAPYYRKSAKKAWDDLAGYPLVEKRSCPMCIKRIVHTEATCADMILENLVN